MLILNGGSESVSKLLEPLHYRGGRAVLQGRGLANCSPQCFFSPLLRESWPHLSAAAALRQNQSWELPHPQKLDFFQAKEDQGVNARQCAKVKVFWKLGSNLIRLSTHALSSRVKL